MKGYQIFLICLAIISTVAYGKRVQNPCSGDNKIPCDNGECIWRFNWCDHIRDCADGSDEMYCPRGLFDDGPKVNCTDKHFNCNNEKCVPASVRCDREWDCFGGVDEDNCDTIDQDESYTSERVTEDFFATSTASSRTAYAYVTPSTSTEYYGRQNENRRYDYNQPQAPPIYRLVTPPPPVYHHYDDNYDQNHPEQNYNRRRSDAYPERSFPSNQHPNAPLPETPSRRTPYVPAARPGPVYVERDTPIVYPPRTILFPPHVSSPVPTRRTDRRPDLADFYFAHNYTKDFEYIYRSNIDSAKAWLLSQRDVSYTWGRDTPRALIALSLTSNSFKSDVEDNELLRKSFQTFLGLKILRNETNIEKIGTTRLAVYINALLATCHDPFDFWGINLVEKLYYTQNNVEQYQGFVNPLIYLTLCLTNKPVDVKNLKLHLKTEFRTEISKDLHILATTAMACIAHRYPHDTEIRGTLKEAVQSLLNEMKPDGSFGSKYSTALAAQALMSVENSLDWDAPRTLDYLAHQQNRDGSFGDMQSTYYTLIALSGRSLVHLRNTQCDPLEAEREWSPADILNGDGPKKKILFNLKVGYPETFSTGIQLSVRQNSSFFEVMLAAAHLYPRYRFEYEVNSLLDVHTIAGIPSDPERGMFWTLYWLDLSHKIIDFKRKYIGDIRSIIPQDGDELLYWYLSDRYTY